MWQFIKNHFLKFLFVIIILICIIISITVAYLFKENNQLSEDKIIEISHDSSIEKISLLLAKENIISNARFFELILKFYSYYAQPLSGFYRFNAYIRPIDVIKIITDNNFVVNKITINEGMVLSDIKKKLNESNSVGDITINLKEGDLLASTYYYYYGGSKMYLVNKMKLAMDQILDEAFNKIKDDKNYPLKSKKEILILASIIEKEAGNHEEKNKIAAVFLNRLKKNMRLQTDPTVIYAITNGKYKLKRRLTYKDLAFNSPYNTYLYYGLPPLPICSPGKESIMAAVSPADVDYLYFVANGRGGHNFSKTLRQHNIYVKQYKNILRKGKNN